jgi:hypothetical protein
MKHLLLTLFSIACLTTTSIAQEDSTSLTKEDLVGTWRVCYGLEIDESADTLRFSHATPECRENNCGEHQWSFRASGSVEFIFTKGCNTGFNSVSKNPKRWIFIEATKHLKFISNDGFKDVYDVLEVTDETLTLVRRRDLE